LQPLHFSFNRKLLQGFAGDTLASALLANGVRVVARSFKFHRPRGVYSCGIEEPNALVQLEADAKATLSVRSTLVELYDGLAAFSQSGWPNVRFDAARMLDFMAPLWAAGFYNKTFLWPNWHAYEWLVRRMAGSGQVSNAPDPDRYDQRNLQCDVLVIGAGVAGMNAAEAAAETGSRVVLVDQGVQLGGRAAWDGTEFDGVPGAAWVRDCSERLGQLGNLRILKRATAVGYYERNVVTLLETLPQLAIVEGAPRERFWTIRANQVVLATGAIEQPLIFCNNDRPGIFLAGAAHEYLRRYAVAVGRRVVVATNNDSAYVVAQDLLGAGVEVVAVVDSRPTIGQALIDELRVSSVPVLSASIPVDTSGFNVLNQVSIGRLAADSKSIESVIGLSCDALLVSAGWNPTLHLHSQAGGKLTFCEHSRGFRPIGKYPLSLVGSAAGQSEDQCGRQPLGIRLSPVGRTQRQWVDLRNDVTVADLELALRENYTSIEHVKRYTTVGMGADQGKTSTIAALDVVARARGIKPSELGYTTMRPPFVPVTLGAIAGRALGALFAPARMLRLHARHISNGAVMEDFGEWKRPVAYLRTGESRLEAATREARAVRTVAGLFDSSSLGKIEIRGPDALDFLDRFYINNLKTLKPGRARYGLMLRETGTILDDGTVVLLAPDRLLVTTTSGNADRVAAWLEEWHQCEWPQLRVAIIPVTEQWATATLAGPLARVILSKLRTDIDLTNEAFPHLAMREGRLNDHPARIYRVSFTGELTYEINVPARAVDSLWNALLESGSPQALQPFGLDALQLLRLEKGFLHIGTDTDATSVPDDVGWGKIAASKGGDFIGKRSLRLPENVRADRMHLIGLVSDSRIIVGSHLRIASSREASDGWVTSAGRMAMTGEPIALAQLRGGRELVGKQVSVHDDGNVSPATVVRTPFYDVDGGRMYG
jgi:sarcosine oxidase subunit alpha